MTSPRRLKELLRDAQPMRCLYKNNVADEKKMPYCTGLLACKSHLSFTERQSEWVSVKLYELNARHVTERKQSIETKHSKLCSHGEEHPTTFLFLVASHSKCDLMSSECIRMTLVLIFSCVAHGVVFNKPVGYCNNNTW